MFNLLKGSSLWHLTYRESTGSSRRRGEHVSSGEIHHFDHQNSHRSNLQCPGHYGGHVRNSSVHVLSLAEPSHWQQIEANAGGVNEHIQHMQNRCQTALHRAASRGHTEIVMALKQTGAPCILHVIQCKTPFSPSSRKWAPEFFESHGEGGGQAVWESHIGLHHSSVKDDNWKLAGMLLQSGATVDLATSPLTSLLFWDVNYIEILPELPTCLDYLLKPQPIPEELRAWTEAMLGSSLFSAFQQSHDVELTVLVESGAHVNMWDKKGHTPVLLVAELGHTEVFR